MDGKDLDKMLADLAAEEETLTDVIKKADVRLARVRAARASLLALTDEEPPEFDGGLADACRTILKSNANRSMSPLEVRDALKGIGYDASKHTNLMASIHSVLKRLVQSNEAKSKEAKDGSGTRYTWLDSRTSKTVRVGGVPFTYIDTNAMKALTDSYAQMVGSMKTGGFAEQLERLTQDIEKIKKGTMLDTAQTLAEALRQK